MPTIVGILTFISRINTIHQSFKAKTCHQYDIHKISKMGICRVLNSHFVDLAFSIILIYNAGMICNLAGSTLIAHVLP